MDKAMALSSRVSATQKYQTIMKHLSIAQSKNNPPSGQGFRPSGSHSSTYGVYEAGRRITPVRVCRPVSKGYYSGYIYPNGEFGLGRIPRKKETQKEKNYNNGTIGNVHCQSSGEDFYDYKGVTRVVPHSERAFSSPILVKHSESSQPTRKYGKNGITPFGRRVVRNISTMMERKFGVRRLGFATLTIPSFPPFLMKAIAKKWGHLVRAFFQEMRREHKRHHRRFQYVSVTELQMARFCRYGESGLHLHFCYPIYKLSSNRGDYFITADWMRSLWRRLLQNVIDATPLGVPYVESPIPRIDIQPVKKSVSAYLSKYMSKGVECIASVIEEQGEDSLPSQWWSCDNLSRAEFKKAIISVNSAIAEFVLYYCSPGKNDYVLYYSCVTIMNADMHETVVGYGGQMSAMGMSAIRCLRCE
jgi:hypothetical protein